MVGSACHAGSRVRVPSVPPKPLLQQSAAGALGGQFRRCISPRRGTRCLSRKTAIRNAKARGKAYKLTDGGCLYLLVNTDGCKYWRIKYRFASKEKLISLGVYPDVRSGEAREKREDAKRLLKASTDPSAARKAQKRAVAIATSNTSRPSGGSG